jgi:hypothetical protein
MTRSVGQCFNFHSHLACGTKSGTRRVYPSPCAELIFRALLATELQAIFANAPQAPNALAHERVRNAYALATGKAPISASSAAKRRIPGPEDSCPICYESMHGVSQEKLVFCEECGNALHSECFEQCPPFFLLYLLLTGINVDWGLASLAGRRSAAELTCVWCRAKWQRAGNNEGSASPTRTSGGYINLGQIAGLSGVRDTSTCMRRHALRLLCRKVDAPPL